MSDSDPLKPKYKRILLKMSGEAFGHGGQTGISLIETKSIAEQIRASPAAASRWPSSSAAATSCAVQFSAGGEIINESTAHYMGMMATIMNGLALQETLESLQAETRLLTALRVDSVAEFYIRRRAIRHLEKGRIVILAGGTGNPHATTDSAASLRGREVEVDVVLKATRVDGIFSEDPEKNPHAVRYERLTFHRAIQENLQVMDMGAFVQCREKNLPIIVFNYKREGAIERAVAGHPIGTFVQD